MLTQEQINDLETMTEHSRYGKILAEAIKVWKEEKIIPHDGIFGVIAENQKYRLKDNRCCLIGAALVGKFVETDDILMTVCSTFNISTEEFFELYRGFDGICGNNSKAWNFANSVKNIVKPVELSFS